MIMVDIDVEILLGGHRFKHVKLMLGDAVTPVGSELVTVRGVVPQV